MQRLSSRNPENITEPMHPKCHSGKPLWGASRNPGKVLRYRAVRRPRLTVFKSRAVGGMLLDDEVGRSMCSSNFLKSHSRGRPLPRRASLVPKEPLRGGNDGLFGVVGQQKGRPTGPPLRSAYHPNLFHQHHYRAVRRPRLTVFKSISSAPSCLRR